MYFWKSLQNCFLLKNDTMYSCTYPESAISDSVLNFDDNGDEKSKYGSFIPF